MKYTYFFLLFAFFFSNSLFCQKVLTTNSGQRILLVDDGSWRILAPSESPEVNNAESGTSLESFKSPKQGKYPINLDQRQNIQNLLTTLLSDEAQLIVNIEIKKRKLSQLKADKKLIKDNPLKQKRIKGQISQTKDDIEEDKDLYNSTSKYIRLANDLLEGKIKNSEKSIASLENINGSENINSGMGGTNTEPIEIKNSIEEPIVSDSKKYPTMFSLDSRRGGKNEDDCEIVFNGYDSDIGEDRKEVKTQSFFSFSQEKMKPYFKTEDYLNCNASVSKVGKSYYLTINIRIKSKDAQKTYGVLRANENVKIQFINGRSVYGRIINNDPGHIESYTGNTIYQGIIELEKGDVKDLKRIYLDNIGIIWSSGYEQYDIYNVDFLVNQFECLNN